jgi:NAD(P)-dependent dehydrogenase (short-subunit alcohol dehydrogenase family)
VLQVLNRFGRIDVLVNNAGLMAGDVAFTDLTAHLWSEIVDTNLWGAFLCCQAVVPAMIHQGQGVIVNITSGAAVRTGFLNIPYGVSKAGLDRLTLGLAAELKEHGIACLSLSPSVSATDTVRRMYPHRQVDAWAQSPELPARALCALLEDEPMQYTGQVISVREYLQSRGLL